MVGEEKVWPQRNALATVTVVIERARRRAVRLLPQRSYKSNKTFIDVFCMGTPPNRSLAPFSPTRVLMWFPRVSTRQPTAQFPVPSYPGVSTEATGPARPGQVKPRTPLRNHRGSHPSVGRRGAALNCVLFFFRWEPPLPVCEGDGAVSLECLC